VQYCIAQCRAKPCGPATWVPPSARRHTLVLPPPQAPPQPLLLVHPASAWVPALGTPLCCPSAYTLLYTLLFFGAFLVLVPSCVLWAARWTTRVLMGSMDHPGLLHNLWQGTCHKQQVTGNTSKVTSHKSRVGRLDVLDGLDDHPSLHNLWPSVTSHKSQVTPSRVASHKAGQHAVKRQDSPPSSASSERQSYSGRSLHTNQNYRCKLHTYCHYTVQYCTIHEPHCHRTYRWLDHVSEGVLCVVLPPHWRADASLVVLPRL